MRAVPSLQEFLIGMGAVYIVIFFILGVTFLEYRMKKKPMGDLVNFLNLLLAGSGIAFVLFTIEWHRSFAFLSLRASLVLLCALMIFLSKVVPKKFLLLFSGTFFLMGAYLVYLQLK